MAHLKDYSYLLLVLLLGLGLFFAMKPGLVIPVGQASATSPEGLLTSTTLDVPTTSAKDERFVRAGSSTVSFTGSEASYFHKGTVSTVMLVTNQAGNILQENAFLPFGEKYSSTSNVNDYLFNEKKRVQIIELYDNNVRYYDSKLGKFTQTDPLLRRSSSNYYYANNNPLILSDPTGETPCIHTPGGGRNCPNPAHYSNPNYIGQTTGKIMLTYGIAHVFLSFWGGMLGAGQDFRVGQTLPGRAPKIQARKAPNPSTNPGTNSISAYTWNLATRLGAGKMGEVRAIDGIGAVKIFNSPSSMAPEVRANKYLGNAGRKILGSTKVDTPEGMKTGIVYEELLASSFLNNPNSPFWKLSAQEKLAVTTEFAKAYGTASQKFHKDTNMFMVDVKPENLAYAGGRLIFTDPLVTSNGFIVPPAHTISSSTKVPIKPLEAAFTEGVTSAR